MNDLFGIEQKIYEDAESYLAEFEKDNTVSKAKYEMLVKEYGRLLNQLRRTTKVSDRVTINLNESKQDLLDKAHYDVLTGIYNRRFLEESLKKIIKSHARNGGVISVLMMDVDHFKKYNDEYGHNKGDSCLKAVAWTIEKSLLRADDYVARYGGEEFTAILPNTDEKGAMSIAARIIENIRQLNIPHEKSETKSCVTISIGLTTARVEQQHTGVDLIKRADEALYQSKQNGRNRYTYLEF